MGLSEFVFRVDSDSGRVTIPVGGHRTARSAAWVLLEGLQVPESAVVWVRRRPTCDYCDRPATRYVRPSHDDTPLCKGCARDHYGTSRAVREATGDLGVTRLVPVERDEWTQPTSG